MQNRVKNRAILSYVHLQLQDAEDQAKENKGIHLIEDKEKINEIKEIGTKIKEYCESVGATRKHLEKLEFVNMNLFIRVREYYNTTKNIYNQTFKDRHVPIAFALYVCEDLERRGYLKLDIDYKKNIDILRESDKLKKEVKQSKILKKEIVSYTELNKYDKCVTDLIDKVYKIKITCKKKRKK